MAVQTYASYFSHKEVCAQKHTTIRACKHAANQVRCPILTLPPCWVDGAFNMYVTCAACSTRSSMREIAAEASKAT